MSKTAKKTAAKTEAAPKTKAEDIVRIPVRVEVTGEYHTGSTSFTLAKGVKVLLPKDSAERHAEAGRVTIL
jgi:Tfp pilus assembly protein PilO